LTNFLSERERYWQELDLLRKTLETAGERRRARHLADAIDVIGDEKQGNLVFKQRIKIAKLSREIAEGNSKVAHLLIHAASTAGGEKPLLKPNQLVEALETIANQSGTDRNLKQKTALGFLQSMTEAYYFRNGHVPHVLELIEKHSKNPSTLFQLGDFLSDAMNNAVIAQPQDLPEASESLVGLLRAVNGPMQQRKILREILTEDLTHRKNGIRPSKGTYLDVIRLATRALEKNDVKRANFFLQETIYQLSSLGAGQRTKLLTLLSTTLKRNGLRTALKTLDAIETKQFDEAHEIASHALESDEKYGLMPDRAIAFYYRERKNGTWEKQKLDGIKHGLLLGPKSLEWIRQVGDSKWHASLHSKMQEASKMTYPDFHEPKNEVHAELWNYNPHLRNRFVEARRKRR